MKGSRLVPAIRVGALLLCALLTTPPVYAQASKSDQMSTGEHIQKGNYFLSRMQFTEALGEYEEALRTNPGSSVAKDNIVLVHNNWGISYFRQKKYEEAEKQWREALSPWCSARPPGRP